MFKKYQVSIEVDKLVHPNTWHGLSRHLYRAEASSAVASIGSERAHKSALRVFARWLQDAKGKRLRRASKGDAAEFLQWRAGTVGQSAVSLGRQAINLHLFPSDPLRFVVSERPDTAVDRAYTQASLLMLKSAADHDFSLSMEIALDAGLRAIELVTIGRPSDQAASQRDWDQRRFLGRADFEIFVVRGKGKLFREVAIDRHLAQRLEKRRRLGSALVQDRTADLDSFYDLLGGQTFSDAFSSLSSRVLGFSHGAHGLRHSFAQRRRDQLLCIGLPFAEALAVLSQELGHFDTKNTLSYLRD
jgi:integrase